MYAKAAGRSGREAARRRADITSERGSGWQAEQVESRRLSGSSNIPKTSGRNDRRNCAHVLAFTAEWRVSAETRFGTENASGRHVQPKRFVYIIKSLTVPATYYVGLTSDMDAQLVFHNAGLSPFTASARPWRRLVVIEFDDESPAAAFERYLKTGSGREFVRRHFRQSMLKSKQGTSNRDGRSLKAMPRVRKSLRLSIAQDDRLALLEQERRERVPQIVDADLSEFRLLQHAREHVADVALLERRALEGGEHPHWDILALFEPSSPLLPAPVEQPAKSCADMSIRRRWCDFVDVATP